MKNDKVKFKIVKPTVIFSSLIVVFIFSLLFLSFWRGNGRNTASALDPFAQCLAEKGITMYGADWCPHCQNEKKAFGSAFRLVPYVECPDDPNRCLAAGISAYPTWIFPASPLGPPASPAGGPDGKKLVGEQGIEKLSQESGCPLPE